MDLVDDRISDECLDGNTSKKEIYEAGVNKFLDYAFSRTGDGGEIKCPCIRCCNTYSMSRAVVYSHLIAIGIIKNYRFWYHHGEVLGEPETDSEDVEDGDSHEAEEYDHSRAEDVLMDLFAECFNPISDNLDPANPNESVEEPNAEASKFYELLDELNKPLYEGSNTSKLSAVVKLLNTKNLGKWSNKSYSMLSELLRKDFLPVNSSLPASYYETKKIMKELGLRYQKIDACHNDCMLYWKDDINAESCKVCKRSRWKKNKHSGEDILSAKGKKIAEKTMRYFPIKKRLQRLYVCRKTASSCTWHKHARVDDGVMRHPADSKAWKHFDEIHPLFASEPRNVRLCLAGDGFQPFTTMRTSYSIWPIFLVPLNLPPWMCSKQQNVFLSMVISGPEGPGDAIDIYLQPLIEELLELWEDGIDTYDACTKTNFKLRATLLWMIHDFPAYGNLSGYSTMGRLACPVCHNQTSSLWLNKGRKFCYRAHRRLLPIEDKWRKDEASFDGTREYRGAPKPLMGDEVLDQVNDLEGIVLSKDPSKKTKISHSERGDNWLKKNVMHIEKNICESIIGTLLNIVGKTKDNINSRLDLQEMNLKPHLHPVQENGKTMLPKAAYVLTPEKKTKFLQFFKDLKVPDSFSANISRCVNMKEQKLSGLKSHDCHVILNHILPVALRGLLQQSKALTKQDLDRIEPLVARTLCKLEMEFPPSFFDCMVHLPVHLASEARLGGPTVYRWMYPFERHIKFQKSLVRNMAHPEGSIAEGYLAYEFINLCSRYLEDVGDNT
ncbi:hypothetical protein U9M48_023579 [Paspalum notatum var. saurae]|uniref:Transposase-associated domain-containing protein n=1 Tax=Paspalum notatum var. saurae TaxID=547442 RepID=A0AAQ3WW50_PASNO